jgi:hypothetical protein
MILYNADTPEYLNLIPIIQKMVDSFGTATTPVRLHSSHLSAGRIMAEVVDKELLHYIEARSAYITTDKGYIFLKKRE